MYLCYMDESGTPDVPGNTSHFVLVGLSIPAWHWRAADAPLARILAAWNMHDAEIHTAWLLRKYLEQSRIPNFENMGKAARKAAVQRERTAHLLKLLKSQQAATYKQVKKNYKHTDDYVHLTLAERKNLLEQVADQIGSWGFCRLFAECIDKIHFDPAKTGRSVGEQAFEQIVSHLAKMRNRSRGTVTLPVVVRVPYGGGIGAVEHHSESPEAYFAHTAGLKVVSPGTPTDGYSLLRQSIEHPDPVIFFEPKRRYWLKEEADLPVETEPFGTAVVRREGTTATLVAYGPMVRTCMEAAQAAEEEGWDLEVVDLRTLTPIDTPALVESVRKTGRAVVVHEASVFCGFGAEVSARITERAFYHLEAPVMRVGAFDTPYAPAKLEEFFLPDVDRILDAVERSLSF